MLTSFIYAKMHISHYTPINRTLSTARAVSKLNTGHYFGFTPPQLHSAIKLVVNHNQVLPISQNVRHRRRVSGLIRHLIVMGRKQSSICSMELPANIINKMHVCKKKYVMFSQLEVSPVASTQQGCIFWCLALRTCVTLVASNCNMARAK